ncbi:MAG: HAD-IC family P-type ATPase [Candidatus Micrarchaeia archaeon]
MPSEDAYPGLTEQEAIQRQKQYGRNELRKPDGKVIKLLISNIINPLTVVLIVVSVILFFLEDQTSAYIVLGLILLNGLLGFYQEFKSERASEKLRKQIAVLCKVRRDGIWRTMPTADLVPGDLVRIEPGDMVPADLKLIYANQLTIDQSSLTGESEAVGKAEASGKQADEKSTAFMGSLVSEGSGEGMVVQIGDKTQFGKTAALLGMAEEESTFEKNISGITKTLIKIIIASAVLIFLVNALTGKDLIESFLFAVALAVGLVPEAMPIIITITLSNGALALSRHGVIAKRLSAIESLGNVDILCTDKTGTLTENKMTVSKVLGPHGGEDSSIMGLAALCVSGIGRLNPYGVHKHQIASNPIDEAITSHAKNGKGDLQKRLSAARILSVIEFNYKLRRMSVLVQDGKERLIITKGSPESILAVCALDKRARESAVAFYKKLGESGYRSIAVAVRGTDKKAIADDDIKDMEFRGLITFYDPPKKTVKEVLDIAKQLGVGIKIISGDNLNIAKYTARSVGFVFEEDQAINCSDIDDILKSDMPEAEKEALLRKKLERTTIFARTNPSEKHFIVKKLKSYGHSVAFMGDGVNDAPAIKEADVGISVNNASDVTKEAADIILLRKSLRAVIQGISGGRKVFTNVVKYILNTLSGNFGDLYTIGFASAFIPFIPLTPVQILLSNFLSDAPMVSISTDNVEDSDILKPSKWDIVGLVRVAAIFGLISTVFDLLVIIYFIHSAQEVFRTALFLEVILSEISVILVLRSTKPIFRAEPLSLPLILGIVASIVIGVSLVYLPVGGLFGFVPIPPDQVGVLVAIIVLYTIATEIVKGVYYRMFRTEVVDESVLRALRRRVSPDLH